VSGPRPIRHEVLGGWCRVCGELESWLRDHGAVVIDAKEAHAEPTQDP